MPSQSVHGKLDSEETDAAAWQATRGAVTGAARWGIYSAVAAGIAYVYSPVYRGLTVQFKVFLQMSGMIFGGVIEADERLRIYGDYSRRQKIMARDAAVWRKYEEEFESLGIPGVASEARAKKERQQEE
ncbi:hypothetical protein E4T44_04791 [Aureobasidium sp. EXF-8845]|nr:hypothetical protein E4T44_08733 [Aureobasidium sp. EXF-8845]KAI4843441.1 hypothetical protein E4T45_08616 [Aureobasidium sp. EXF-8846]KAI4846924.1 hypothetical protein E4T44_04791 [Aureobasidium sp. EXF-8845]KAI4851131.1 hypothetical protein E4T45_05213 [Aureobasidium sp. EXF-8846]